MSPILLILIGIILGWIIRGMIQAWTDSKKSLNSSSSLEKHEKR